jgi:hypothetical protein
LSSSISARISAFAVALRAFRHVAEFGGDAHVGIAAELDVGAAAGHVGGDGDGARHAGLGDDEGFLLVVAGVEQHIDCAVILFLGGGNPAPAGSVELEPCFLSISARISDFSIEVVPTRTGWPALLACVSSTMALYFSSNVR